MTLRADGPEYVPLRTFRDDDLLDPGSDPLIALMGALSALYEGERVVARLLLRSLGPDWSQGHMEKAHKRPGMEPREPAYTYQTKPLQLDGVTMAVLGIGALAALKGYLWVQDGEIWKAALLGVGTALGMAAGGWAWWRWKKARSRVEDPILIGEKVSRIAFDAELQITAIVPSRTMPQRAGELLGPVAAAYRHYDNPAGARFKVSRVRHAAPDPDMLHPPGPGLFGARSVLGVREIASLWHPPGAGDETPLVERSGARALSPSAKGTRGGALVGDTTAGARREIRFPEDLLRRHHLYVARTRMGKSTLMHHVVTHKMAEKAAGRDGDAIVVVDPHTDLVAGILEHVPESLADRVRLIDLSDESRAPGINLLDTRIFSDRDRTADSVVRVAKGLWEQWGPEDAVHPRNRPSRPFTRRMNRWRRSGSTPSSTGLKLLSNEPFRKDVLKKVSDPYLLEWWASTFTGWSRDYRPTPWPRSRPVSPTTHRRRGQGPSWGSAAQPSTCAESSTTAASCWCPPPRDGGQGRRRPGGRVAAQPRGRRDTGAGTAAAEQAQGRPRRGGRDAVHARCGLREHVVRAGQVRGELHPRNAEPRQAGRPLTHHAGHPSRQHGLSRRLPGGGQRRPDACLGAGQGAGDRGRHHVAPRPPLLRPRHSGQGADARLLDDGQEAGGGRAGHGFPHPGRRLRLHRIGREGDYANADGHKKVGDYRKGVEDLEKGGRESRRRRRTRTAERRRASETERRRTTRARRTPMRTAPTKTRRGG